MSEIKLTSVNWEHGMLLTPEHFLRQENYVDALTLWTTRYLMRASGLIGGGPRLHDQERGAVRHDPVITVVEDTTTINITISQVRGLTTLGQIIDVSSTNPVHASIPKSELAGVAHSYVYVLADSGNKHVTDGVLDEFNPQMKTERSPAYRILLRPEADQMEASLSVARLSRPPVGTGYEKDSKYIPPCTTLVSHSELAAGWRKILEAIGSLAQRYASLHRAMREFLLLFTERGIETDGDREAAAFVERMVIAVQSVYYEALDPIQSPHQLFGQLKRFFHSSATFLDLCPSVRQYFEMLKDTGETEFVALVEQQHRMLQFARSTQLDLDLSTEIHSAMKVIYVLSRLERALEGKYVDFHLSQTLEAMNFIFDRGGKVLFKMVAKPMRLQGVGEDLTIHFTQLKLEGRDRYRLILVGEQNAAFARGYKISVELRINEGSGFRREPLIINAEASLDEQYNFDFDFEAPDVPTILDLRVTLQAHHPIRTALLFARHRFYSSEPAATPALRPLAPIGDALEPSVQRTRYAGDSSIPDLASAPPMPAGVKSPPRSRAGFESSQQLPSDYRGDPRMGQVADEDSPPWGNQAKDISPKPPQNPPVRRRRLE